MKIRTTIAASLVALTLPVAPLMAHDGEITVNCEVASVNFSNFGYKNVADAEVVVRNSSVTEVHKHSWKGATSSVNVPVAHLANGSPIIVSVTWTGTHKGSAGPVSSPSNCNPPAKPEEPVTPVTPVVPPAPPVAPPPSKNKPVIDCAYLRSKGAGLKWLRQYNCVTVRKSLTCADLKRRGAGRAWYKRNGINYWDCHVPKSKPGIPAVAGEHR